ncbi:MAG: DUF502 domain-containing protein [Candidatus Omnitrophica bacterium]|nr:DUF502 domain-containing protein [bacterium]MCL4734946.1 DUF502 domain-containing protein [Candidatus Omnitrophota bacterium]
MEPKEKHNLPEQLAENIIEALHVERGFWARLRRHFLAGLLVLTPLGVTLWVVSWLVNLVDGKTRHFLTRVLSQFGLDYSFTLFGHNYSVIPFGFGILIVFIGICFAGMITGNFIGNWFLKIIEAVIRRVPGVSWIYNAADQMSQAFFNRKTNLLESVVIVEYPRRGMFGIGFVTARDIPNPLQADGGKVNAVFIPTTPNPTSGFLLLIPHDECISTQMTVEEGMKVVISGGVVIPPLLKKPDSPVDPEDAA